MDDLLLPLTMFAFVGAFTPGPNNIMVTASGANFGLARTWPHILGVTIGFAVMQIAFGFGLGQVFKTYPAIHQVLRVAGALYLLYFAARIAGAGGVGSLGTPERPLTFMQGALFQWVNPKAWTLALGVIASFTRVGGDIVLELAVIIAIFAIMTVASLVAWCLFGMAIRRFLSSPRALRITNLAMAALLALSVGLLFL